ncbi:MotA/TolQ/ExbB proton channel family protein [Planctomicrobium sp. SH668]|uniref:MotA/TolQ/ExbB proton channel family protein n=1 Tax=Planctomicrobium sp. SH668 TaxID=3448126 RepID=UPI003F5B5618
MFRHSSKFAVIACFTFALLAFTCLTGSKIAYAQAEGEAPAAAPAAEAAPAAAPEAAGEAAAPDSKAHPQKSYLAWVIHSSGWIGAIILLLSIYFVAMVFRQYMELRPQTIAPPALLEECETLLKAGDFQGIYRVAKADESMLASLLATGMSELQYGLPEAREAMDRSAEVKVAKYEAGISMMAVLGTLGPMIGLLGTLKGMISAFSVIALSGESLDPGEVADAISEALLLTFEGVALSIPAIFFYAMFRNRISVLTSEAMLMADVFVRRMNAMYRGKGSSQEAAAE